MATIRNYLKGEFITHREDIWPFLLFVHSGEFQALKESRQGRVFIVENFLPGDMFWGLALLESQKGNPVAIRASMDGELLLWHKQQIERIISTDIQVVWGIFALLANKMGRAGEIVEDLVFQPLPGRLAYLLLNQFEDAVDAFVSRDLTLEEMAARIGTTKEMVCKILYKFSDQGLIDIQRTQLKINDREKLELLAER